MFASQHSAERSSLRGSLPFSRHAPDPPAMINDYIEVNPRKLGGTPVFRETRIPVYVLFDYLEEGYTVEDFLDEYDIAPEVVRGFLRAIRGTFVTEEEVEA